jgi:hypothetical protein
MLISGFDEAGLGNVPNVIDWLQKWAHLLPAEFGGND